MSKYHQGATKAWKTRKQKGWKRKTLEDKRLDLLAIAEKKKKKRIVKALKHRYRSKARLRQVIQDAAEDLMD